IGEIAIHEPNRISPPSRTLFCRSRSTLKIAPRLTGPRRPLARMHAALIAYGFDPIDQPRFQTRHGSAHHSHHTGRPQTDSTPSCRTNRVRSTLHHKHNSE